jgi:hypothetical protein
MPENSSTLLMKPERGGLVLIMTVLACVIDLWRQPLHCALHEQR